MIADLAVRRESFLRCWRHSPGLTLLSLCCIALNSVSFAVVGLGLRAVVDGSIRADFSAIVVGAAGAAAAYTIDLVVGQIGFELRTHVVGRVTLTEVQPEVMRATMGVDTIEHLERSDYLDRIGVVRAEVWRVVDSGWAAIEAFVFVVRLGAALAVLATVSPLLLGLLVVAVVPLLLEWHGGRRMRDAEAAAAEDRRLERHLLALAIDPGAGKELRVAGAADRLLRRQRQAWESAATTVVRARLVASLWSALGWSIFALGFIGGLVLLVRQTAGSPAAGGDLVLAITVGAQLRFAVEQAVERSIDAGGAALVLAPYRWLREYHAGTAARGGPGLAPPARLTDGIVLDDVSFTYPGTDRLAVDRLSARLPAGAIVAVVGEYGSGKSTLVKLLAKLYRPDSGAVRVDGTDLADLDTAAWRAAMSAAFQDFGRYRTTVAEGVGLGDPAGMDSAERIRAAIRTAGAEEFVDRLPQGTDTMLSTQFGGVELSEGQWQKVALARACMRAQPLLFVLDEPTASLDAPSERAIFEAYMTRARAIRGGTGAITVVVSHRFSTVAGADLILVLEAGRLVESGTHASLLARAGRYAALYDLQAKAYA
ncbi:ABC transporter ATP-binding protein [Plantactinospora mayteni]|uniref:ABC transporter permease n=1 Tax=Plantactinospora mayteni TaxID=566021 RepID=A0ABQ4EFK7_9ACTN|nr:ABC transporter ATP-binding protein [Plantactinospora mayteni]GIG93505.1 ABC transporter permease [Plantactinospora mayteni]